MKFDPNLDSNNDDLLNESEASTKQVGNSSNGNDDEMMFDIGADIAEAETPNSSAKEKKIIQEEDIIDSSILDEVPSEKEDKKKKEFNKRKKVPKSQSGTNSFNLQKFISNFKKYKSYRFFTSLTVFVVLCCILLLLIISLINQNKIINDKAGKLQDLSFYGNKITGLGSVRSKNQAMTIDYIDDYLDVYQKLLDEKQNIQDFFDELQVPYKFFLRKIMLPSLNIWYDPYLKKIDTTIVGQDFLEKNPYIDTNLMVKWSDFFKRVSNNLPYNEIESINLQAFTKGDELFEMPVSVNFNSPQRRSFLMLIDKLAMTSNKRNISYINEFFYELWKSIVHNKKDLISLVLQKNMETYLTDETNKLFHDYVKKNLNQILSGYINDKYLENLNKNLQLEFDGIVNIYANSGLKLVEADVDEVIKTIFVSMDKKNRDAMLEDDDFKKQVGEKIIEALKLKRLKTETSNDLSLIADLTKASIKKVTIDQIKKETLGDLWEVVWSGAVDYINSINEENLTSSERRLSIEEKDKLIEDKKTKLIGELDEFKKSINTNDKTTLDQFVNDFIGEVLYRWYRNDLNFNKNYFAYSLYENISGLKELGVKETIIAELEKLRMFEYQYKEGFQNITPIMRKLKVDEVVKGPKDEIDLLLKNIYGIRTKRLKENTWDQTSEDEFEDQQEILVNRFEYLKVIEEKLQIYEPESLLITTDIINSAIISSVDCSLLNDECYFNFREKFRSVPRISYLFGLKSDEKVLKLKNFLLDIPPILNLGNFTFEENKNIVLGRDEGRFDGNVSVRLFGTNVTEDEFVAVQNKLGEMCFGDVVVLNPQKAKTVIDEKILQMSKDDTKIDTQRLLNLQELAEIINDIDKKFNSEIKYKQIIKTFELYRMLLNMDLCQK